MNDDDVKRTLRELRHGIAECMRRLNSLEEQVYSLQHAQPKGISLVERIDARLVRLEGLHAPPPCTSGCARCHNPRHTKRASQRQGADETEK